MDIVKQAWETYVAHSNDIPDHIEGVRDEIIQSWKRCKQQLDPFQKQMSFVSSDILGKKYGAIVDGLSTSIVESDGTQLVKIVAWYDNEYGYTAQMLRTAKKMFK